MTTAVRQKSSSSTGSATTGPSLEMPHTDHHPHPYNGPSKAEVMAMRKEYCNPAIFTLYKEPLMIVEGYMQYLYDETGRRYLDMLAGIVTVSCGHCHPKVTAKIKEQVDTLQHATTIYLHPNMPALAKKLASKMPKGLDVTYFVNSGSEANDLAIQMARLYTGNPDVIAVRNSYHGASPSSNTITSHSTWKYPVNVATGVHHTICPDPYRSPFSGTPEEIATKSVADLKDLIRFGTSGAIAAFIMEPIQGVGGTTYGAPNYLKEAYAVAREHGGLCIADEVQTGFGRTGDHYWGFQNFDVVPDFVVMAKGIGNGVPLAAVTTRMEIAQALTQRVHFNTFGGNPVCMAAGLAVLDVIDEDGLQENCRVVGKRLKDGLKRLMNEHDLIGDVRGMGLMLGVEFVRDRATKEPAKAETLQILEEARGMGVLIGKGGIDGNVVRIKPPMCITAEDADYALEVIHRALQSVESA
jgi:alanine-glyoxylate transaminase/(R)-3-amino-2-methylpropionate-pyruvate transaminase